MRSGRPFQPTSAMSKASPRHRARASDRQIELVSASVAAPVRGPGGHVVAALSIVVVPTPVSHARRYVPAVLTASRGISRNIGFERNSSSLERSVPRAASQDQPGPAKGIGSTSSRSAEVE